MQSQCVCVCGFCWSYGDRSEGEGAHKATIRTAVIHWVHLTTACDYSHSKVNLEQSQLPHPDSQRRPSPASPLSQGPSPPRSSVSAHLDGVHLLNKLLDLIHQTLVLLLRRLLHSAALSQLRDAEIGHKCNIGANGSL